MVWGKSGKLILILSPYLWYFFQFDSHPVVYLSIWEMHMAHVHVMGFPINFWCQIFHSVGKYNKPMVWVKSWKLILIFFPYYAMGAFLPLDSSTLMHGILYHLGNALVSLIINFSQYGKMQQNPLNEFGEPVKLVLIFFLQWVIFPIQFPSYGVLHQMGNACHGFPHQFHKPLQL